jgi:hypothetical protein
VNAVDAVSPVAVARVRTRPPSPATAATATASLSPAPFAGFCHQECSRTHQRTDLPSHAPWISPGDAAQGGEPPAPRATRARRRNAGKAPGRLGLPNRRHHLRGGTQEGRAGSLSPWPRGREPACTQRYRGRLASPRALRGHRHRDDRPGTATASENRPRPGLELAARTVTAPPRIGVLSTAKKPAASATSGKPSALPEGVGESTRFAPPPRARLDGRTLGGGGELLRASREAPDLLEALHSAPGGICDLVVR